MERVMKRKELIDILPKFAIIFLLFIAVAAFLMFPFEFTEKFLNLIKFYILKSVKQGKNIRLLPFVIIII